MRLIWDELNLVLDALFEMRIRADQESRATIGALGVKVIGELRALWPTLCSGAERNPTGTEIYLTQDEKRLALEALEKAREKMAPEQAEAIGALALKLSEGMQTAGQDHNQGGKE